MQAMNGSRARDKRDYGPHSSGWPRAANKRAGVSVSFDARLLRRREKREALAEAREQGIRGTEADNGGE